jgi:hypothetical protein
LISDVLNNHQPIIKHIIKKESVLIDDFKIMFNEVHGQLEEVKFQLKHEKKHVGTLKDAVQNAEIFLNECNLFINK